MASLIDRSNLDFLLNRWLKVDELLARPSFAMHDLAEVSAYLDLAEELAGDKFLTHYKLADQIEPTLTEEGVEVLPQIKRALEQFAAAGFFSAPFPETYGGLQFPELVQAAGLGLFMAANLATSAYAMLTIANARLLVAHGSPAQAEAFARPQIEGRVLGTMCLSEPQAGSSLGDIRTRAEPDGDSIYGPQYRITGNKMWISGGDQNISENIFHLVLAKIPETDGCLPEGTKGISLFIVPKFILAEDGSPGIRNDVDVAGINHKMGYRGTSNCLLNFGEGTRFRPGGRAGAVGYLVGEPGAGLAIMFHMMNEARINVGLGAASVACRAHLLSVAYSQERMQGRLERNNNPVPLIAHPDVRRMLLAQKCYAEGALSLILYAARLVDDRETAETDEERAEADLLLGLLTPAAKTWASEWGLAANDIAIQIHGGYGYTRDFDVEQLYRDNRLNPIHEGTTGIQGIDFVGRKIQKDGGAALITLGKRIRSTCISAAAADERLRNHAADLEAVWDEFVSLAQGYQDVGRDVMLSNATELLQAFGHLVVGWLWLDQALVTSTTKSPLQETKVACCDFYFQTEMPRVTNALHHLAHRSPLPATVPLGVFGVEQ
ncbi:alkylation response protein AidB-like acyl-CoA dehydrogenase [Microvirga lupini]|uniref:Alkylation response protein AidB-like acyl-CoA dehydrogenase n=1 Tax=Microvirga lupini TaxID=420324 RepID=A0A7W4VJU5_9HYPH|nr:acyl-CoA dehydrogenase [Microvirga lupini]MBB3018120.1 alkylation response protein AidB-like acyl-CoA dehydrogenase [Microvirga lupini]